MFRETPEVLLTKVQNLLRVNLHIRRDIPITKVSRMYTGKIMRNCVLRKSYEGQNTNNFP